ncbi:hypothetical protein FQR65_LT12358 [Abscondita terminalis]|nr:hypothetical protein FQR65_LT12358 [Abscondita terminalis]
MLQQAQTQNELSVEDLKALSKNVELKSKRDENAICCLQTDVQSLQNDLRELKSDKYFLQQLSVEHSSPSNFLDSPSVRQFDETYINGLFQRSNLHSSLNLLKNEMASLRRQVVENSLCKLIILRTTSP